MPGTTAAAVDAPTPPIPCPQIIGQKVRQFDEHLETYSGGDYSEAQLRVDFLNPMLECLGWDVNNRHERAEAYREVVYEDAVKVGGTSKAPDYGFYIGGRAAGGGRKFFLEAKKPAVAIRVDPAPAFQLRRYAYSAQLPLSILTNFKDFIVYDTRYRPSPKDKATAAAILQIKYSEYPERWHEIASVFSQDAILRGAFDKYAQGKRRKGMEPLGDAFLEDIEGWRKLLAKDLAANNPKLSVEELNFAVQRTIDRILFLRICEDRGIEQPRNLMQLLNGDHVYQRLGKILRDADDRYNSGIFHFPRSGGGKKPDPDRAEPPDDLTLDLDISDKAIQNIIRGLYDTGKLFTSYAFAVIPPDILGHVYEQFLGKVINLTAAHHVKIEEKPEVRKAGGVYYTPTYIVDYIVKNTVGKLLGDPRSPSPSPSPAVGEGEGRGEGGARTAEKSRRAPSPPTPLPRNSSEGEGGMTPADAAKIRILDPASGSGSFLIGAYQYLLDWHLRWYLEHDPESHCKGRNPPLVRSQSPSLGDESESSRANDKRPYDYRLSTQKRKEILLNSIYGVDIDPQAVEVTKLSLLLKVLEGESQDSLSAQMKFFHQRALPDLGRNIKCGNSLIGDDFDDSELSNEERKKINKFNWQRGFPAIFKSGGFDAVIGNPPYLAGREWDEHLWNCRSYFDSQFSCMTDQYDLYALFIQQAVQLLKVGGQFGFITPNTWLNNEHYGDLRRWLAATTQIARIADYRDVRVFSATVLPIIIIAASSRTPDIEAPITVEAFVDKDTSACLQTSVALWREMPGDVFNLALSSDDLIILRKIEAGSWRVEEKCDVRFGVKVYQKGKGRPPQKGHESTDRIFDSEKRRSKDDLPYLWGEHISRYFINPTRRWINYGPHLAEPRSIDLFHGSRVLVRRIVSTRLVIVPTNEILVADQLIHTVRPKSDGVNAHFVAGILGSALSAFYFRKRYNRTEKTFPEIRVAELNSLPIRTIDLTNKSDKAAHDRMVKLVDRMLDLHKQLASAKSPVDKERLPREIEATDRQIDALVYELYGLTEEEIRIVDETAAG